jgi:hypothetical protein
LSELRRHRTGSLVRAALAAASLAACAPAPATPSSLAPEFQPLPDFPSQGLRVRTDASTSGVLRVRFDNTDLYPRVSPRTYPATYIVAGAPKQTPAIRVTACRFYYVRNGRIVAETGEMPAAGENATAKLNAVRITPLGLFRQYQTYSLALYPEQACSYAGSTTGYWLLDFLEADMDLGAPPAGDPGQERRARLFEGFGAETLLNPNIDASYLQTTTSEDWGAARRWAERVNSAAATAPVYKLGVYEPGVYSVDAPALSAASGGRAAPKPPAAWRLYRGGEEVPVLRNTNPARPAIVFVATPFDTIGQGSDSYWLTTGDEIATPPLTMDVLQTAAPDAETSVCEAAKFQVLEERLMDYSPHLRPSPEVSRWFWKSAGDAKTAALELNLPANFSPDTASTVSITVYFGLANPVPVPPAVEMIVNGVSTRTVPVTGNQGSLSFEIAPAPFKPGRNGIGLRVRYPEKAPNTQDVQFQRLVASWSQRLAPPMDPALSFHADALGTAPVTVRIPGGASPQAQGALLMFMGPGRPFAILPASAGGAYAEQRGVRGPYRLVDPAAASPPPVVTQVRRLALFDEPRCGDYLAITHRSLQGALTPLLERRAAEGFRPAVVDVETIYDHFSHGNRSSEAIRSFLAWAFYEWAPPKPAYVLLAGEASEYRGDPAKAPPRAQMELVPVNGGSRMEALRGDQPYSTVAGKDAVCDMAVGRISVATPDELAGAIRKIIAFESAPEGDWSRFAEFVTDDNEEFPKVADSVIRRSVAPLASCVRFRQSDFPYAPNLKVSGRRRSREATRALMDDWNRGAGVLNFFGHGGPNLWTHERLFHVQFEVPRITNAPRLPLLTCASCDNAWLDYPLPPVNVSMGELFVKRPNGGAIAVFAPVSGASPFEHETLVAHLMDGIYRCGGRRAGALAMAAKNRYFAETMSSSIPDQYVLVGDPAVGIRVPAARPGLKVSPAAVGADRYESVEVRLDGAVGLPEEGRLRIVSLENDDTIASQPAVVLDGAVNARLSARLPAGSYAAVLDFTTPSGTVRYAARIGSIPVEPVIDAGAFPKPVVAEVGTTVPVVVRVLNPSSADMTGMELSVAAEDDSGASPRVLFADRMDLPGKSSVEWRAPWRPENGETLRVCAAIGDNAATSCTIFSPGMGKDPDSSHVLKLLPGSLATTPEPPNAAENVTVRASLVNGGRDTVRNVRALLLDDGKPVSEPLAVQDIPPDTIRQISLNARSPLTTGTRALTLQTSASDKTGTETGVLQFSFPVTVEVRKGPEVSIVPGSVTVERELGRMAAQHTVFVRAQLANSGETAARGVPVTLLVDDPASGREAQSINESATLTVPEVPAGGTAPVLFRWENAKQPGTQRVWLSVNRNRPGAGQGQIEKVPDFDLGQINNYEVTALQVTPQTAEPGARVRVKFTVAATGSYEDGPVDVECGLRNPLTGDQERERLVIPWIKPGDSITTEVETTVTAGLTEAFVNANATRELEELTPGDNTTAAQILVLHDLKPLPKSRTGGYLLAKLFPDCSATNAELLPEAGFRVHDRMANPLGMTPFDPSWVANRECLQDSATTASKLDGRWSAAPWRLEASREEQAGQVCLSVPTPPVPAGVPCDVFAVVPFSQTYQGGRIALFEARAACWPDFRSFDATAPGGFESDQRVLLGRFDTAGKPFEVCLRQKPGTGVVVVGFEFCPAAGFVESPAIRIPREGFPRLASLRFVDDGTSGSFLRSAFRLGRLGEDGTMEWRDWSPWGSRVLTIPELGGVLQWKVAIVPGHEGALPSLKEAELVIP